MLEVAAGIVAILLVLTGVAIMIGPRPWRAARLRREMHQRAPRAAVAERVTVPEALSLNPTTQRALSSAQKLVDLLTDHGAQRHATAVRLAASRLRQEEVNGIYAMRDALGHLERVRVDDRADQEILQGLISTIRRALHDRAEQLELLPGR